MKRKNIERAVILSLLFGSVAMPAWADYTPLLENGEWTDTMDNLGQGASITGKKTFTSIDVEVTGVENEYAQGSGAYDRNTTTALLVSGTGTNVTVNGPVRIINTAQHDKIDNNNALYVTNSAIVNIIGGDNEIFIYSDTGTGTGRDDAAISAKYTGHVTLSGNNAKIIGSIDFANIASGGSGKDNYATITLNSANSFWYGNEAQAPTKAQFAVAIDQIVNDEGLKEKAKTNPLLAGAVTSLESLFNSLPEDQFNSKAVAYVGSGTLDLTLEDGAEWVYNTNGNEVTPVEKDTIKNLLLGAVKGEQYENIYISAINTIFNNLSSDTIDTPTQSEVDRISAITLNGGVVNLQDDDIKAKYAAYIGDLSEYKDHQKVTIGTLNGSGIFKVDLDWEGNKGINYGDKATTYNDVGPTTSDYIYIENVGESGTQTLSFDAGKAHLENMTPNESKLYFANVADGSTTFITADSVYSSAANIYDYSYGTGSATNETDNSTDWYIEVTGKTAASNANVQAAKAAMYAGYALGTELDTLNKRMGEARYLEDDNGLWVRYRHSKTGWDNTYKTNSNMFQLGFDNKVTEKDGEHNRGIALDYTDANTNLTGISGEGEQERYAVSLYDTWTGDKGHYRDLVLRGGRINSDYDISGRFTGGLADIGGDYHQWFGSISAEWGRKNAMGSGWYIEPQLQAQLARIGGASYISDSGINVTQDGATSLIGRAGFRLGREYAKADGAKHDNYYIKANLLHEFAGDRSFSVTAADGSYAGEYDGDDTWFDIGLGADIALAKDAYLWVDVERTLGSDFDNTWQINGGLRWEW